MLHLAQVKKNLHSGQLEIELLASQQSENTWKLCQSKFVPLEGIYHFNEGLLTIVELNENWEIISIKEARDWVLDLVQKYLTKWAITPQFVEEEQARVEQWRQELTVQTQDLTRIRLEIETRREQLQELEESLQIEKEKLESESIE